ncbi:hypothetical protein CHGG_02175 [Chaetomium globosum CBS 148.51]|uniref:DUF7580 domain-containing protein n=1 Tax=Chaetomium globosum (strain ATCC 6205 / CBS 148.51 / DSM 1962 / NBRC 6347 / NRRL 1970) TaxID=306901 RepID=Q2HC79_CHAGB|nr:uncharacterized protein CHGG_02175 [Chaetomium globosum CBS 148.51]EAQ90240.1 hypothetical protein CHGG_02175 [Chaetomium globosum CBS 148.51]
MSGFEIAGIVLAVLPLFVEAGKFSASTASLLKNAAGRSTRDRKLTEFYDEFYWETYEMHKQMEQIVSSLPDLSEERRMQILNDREVQSCVDGWAAGSDLAQALHAFFASDNDVAVFLETMDKVLRLFYQLIEDETVKISKSDIDFERMSEKMKIFQAQKAQPSGFWERLRFLRREKRRDICLANLRRWRCRLERTIDYATRRAEKQNHHGHHPTGDGLADSEAEHLLHLRSMSKRLFRTLSAYWVCGCGIAHQARLSLAAASERTPPRLKRTELDLAFLIKGHGPWNEMLVVMKDISAMTTQCSELGPICAAIEAINGRAAQYGLRLVVEDSETPCTPRRIFLLEPAPRKLGIPTVAAPVSLRDLLLATQQPGELLTKRRLALTLAYSVLQFHESAFFSSNPWSEDQIFFFHSPASRNAINYQQPYIESAFGDTEGGIPGSSGATPGIFHPNIGILRLGVLLIELHTWLPIEKFRDGQDTTPNADYATALRVLDMALGDCFPTYKSAIRACLDVDWVPAGSRVSLEDSTTCDGLYRNVILPIQEEIEWGERMARKHSSVARLGVP